MRVAMVSPFDPSPPASSDAGRGHVGGVERVLLHLARELAARGHEVTIVCSSEAPRSPALEGRVRVVRARRLGTLFRAPVARLAPRLPRDADVVHVPATYPFVTVPALRAGHRLEAACVLDFHFEPHPPALAGRAAARAYGSLAPRAYRLADVVLVRSLAYARSARSLRRVPQDRLCSLPNGVDTTFFRPRPGRGGGRRDAPNDHRRGYVLFVGRLVPYKGLGVLLQALAGLREAPWLLVAGDGPLRRDLEAAASRLGVRARFLGRVSDEALRGLYRGARLTALPSVNGQEAFGVALLESMACGTPVVASRLPGVAEVAALGGGLAAPGDPADWARALEAALRNGGLPRGEALAARVRARYAWPVVAERLLEAYEAALGASGAGGAREVVGPAHPGGRPLLRP